MERTARCACKRLILTVSGEPEAVLACHCDHCLRRGGGSYPVIAWFDREQVIARVGEESIYNGLEANGEAGFGGLVNHYRFCPTCGSSVYWTFEHVPDSFPQNLLEQLPRTIAIPVGCFADPEFPAPSMHLNPDLRPAWLTVHQAG